MKKLVSLLFVLISPLLVAGSTRGQAQYTVTDLGRGGGVMSAATGVNNSGQVVGVAVSSPGVYQDFLYSGGSMQFLGTASSGTAEFPNCAINNAGQVMAGFTVAGGYVHALLYSSGSTLDIGTLGGTTTWACGMNNLGQIVGESKTSGGYYDSFLYSGGTMHDLGIRNKATCINDLGEIAVSMNNQAYTLSSGGSLQVLPSLSGGTPSAPSAINNQGQIVGYAQTAAGNDHAVVWQGNGAIQDLGTLGGIYVDSQAAGVNNSGQVVGYSFTSSSAGQNLGAVAGGRAFLYSSGTMQNLNSLVAGSGWTLLGATGINDKGQIVGDGITPAGQIDAFLLTPTGQWLTNGSGTWSAGANWAGGQPQAAAVFGSSLTSGTATVTLDTSATLSSLSFSTTGANSYVISVSSTGKLTLTNSGGAATISDAGGDDRINAPIVLQSNLSVSATTGSALTIAGGIAASGESCSLSLSGGGELILSDTDTYTGGTTIAVGILEVANADALPAGARLTVGAGGAFCFDPRAAGATAAIDCEFAATPNVAAAPVPEPSSVAMLCVAAAALGGIFAAKMRP